MDKYQEFSEKLIKHGRMDNLTAHWIAQLLQRIDRLEDKIAANNTNQLR